MPPGHLEHVLLKILDLCVEMGPSVNGKITLCADVSTPQQVLKLNVPGR